MSFTVANLYVHLIQLTHFYFRVLVQFVSRIYFINYAIFFYTNPLILSPFLNCAMLTPFAGSLVIIIFMFWPFCLSYLMLLNMHLLIRPPTISVTVWLITECLVSLSDVICPPAHPPTSRGPRRMMIS